MKKIKNMLKKGGIADIVTLMVIVGLVVALIIAVILPMTQDASMAGAENEERIGDINSFTDSLASGNVGSALDSDIANANATNAH